MSSLKRLSANQLNKMLIETKAELKRRESINEARKEIQATLKKYNLTIRDIDFVSNSRKPAAKKGAPKKGITKNAPKKKSRENKAGKALHKKDQRAFVAPKFHNPATGDKWSGRGRSPVWVTSLCAAETIDIEQFKADPRFRIQDGC